MQFVPVILCGGPGTRLWPLSRSHLPKQFLPLVSERTMLQETVARLKGLEGAQAPIAIA
ncbi:MAG TPA: sugar phosphate nucleotidyltransferase, partial [Pseudolabrys sp.]|nr:sugar phosphate nucleotidyltransferase [Pseudolabrys sp.]